MQNIAELQFQELAPAIFVYANALPKEMNIVQRIENAINKSGSRFKWFRPIKEDIYRTCFDFQLGEHALLPLDEFSQDLLELEKNIRDILKRYLDHYKTWNGLKEVSYMETISVSKYGSGNFFKTHADDTDFYRCTVSIVGYPNDDYEGGELKFPKFNLTYKPKAGDLILFPSAYAYAHSSEPVIGDGVKYSLITMTDKNHFSHKKDSPIYYEPELLQKHGFEVHGMGNKLWKQWKTKD